MSISVPGAPVQDLGEGTEALALDPELLHVVTAMVEHRSGELVYMRRWLHARPEVSRAEHETTAALRERLMVEGLDPQVLRVGTGLVCDIGTAGPLVALRADIDALAMHDAKDVPYRSIHDGACHACGHDVHMAVVLGAGLILRDLIASGRVRGRIRLIFEPSEEDMPGGALDVIDEGWLEGVGGVFGVHCDPKLRAGRLGCRIGPITSASDRLAVRLTGPGGHTARPGLTVNLADEAARLVRELPGAVQDAVHGLGLGPSEAGGLPDAVRDEIRLVFGSIHTGSAANVIPAEAELTGSLRTPDPGVSDALPTIVPRAIAAVLATDMRPYGAGHHGARSDGLRWELDHQRGVTAVVNDAEATRMVARAARAAGGADAVADTPHSWGGDTFGWYLDHAPGCYARLGTHPPGPGEYLDLHRPTFDVDERSIPFGATSLVLASIGWLAHLEEDPHG
ncbi:MAG: amidohydrolase [Candidatus Nanopelagicales bacterium]|jgi:amidohydrolase|nr:amidohydrolase [Candidatus Nanopelagicales bacterium]